MSIDYEIKNYSSSKLYVLNPSKIVSMNKKNIAGILYYTVTFERQNVPVIAYFDYMFKDVFDNKKSNSKYYYDEGYLRENGVTRSAIKYDFINVFDGDVTLLSDFVFAQNVNKNLLCRFKYFKYPFRNENMDLKEHISNMLLNYKQYYTQEELLTIKEEHLGCKNNFKQLKRNYKAANVIKNTDILFKNIFERRLITSGTSYFEKPQTKIRKIYKTYSL